MLFGLKLRLRVCEALIITLCCAESDLVFTGLNLLFDSMGVKLRLQTGLLLRLRLLLRLLLLLRLRYGLGLELLTGLCLPLATGDEVDLVPTVRRT